MKMIPQYAFRINQWVQLVRVFDPIAHDYSHW